MKTKIITLFIACFIISNVFAQKDLNNYKYVIVPNNYDFLKQKDQYQLNSLTQFLFNKYGFKAIMEGEGYPDDLKFNRCLALKADVNKGSGMFKTKLAISLKDCNDKLVYTSGSGESREKEFKTAYNEALRKAFLSIEALNYKYEPSGDVAVPVVAVAAVSEVSSLNQEKTIGDDVKEAVSGVLYAQEIENGYQLVDSSPKVVYKLKKTNLDNVFLVENKSAIVFKKGDDWVVEYYENNTLKQQTLNVKF